jgi:hypothetical protein
MNTEHRMTPQLIFCDTDDVGVRCWEFDDLGYISEADYEFAVKHPEHLAVIESHNEFRGWKAKCPDCWSSEEQCVCSEEEDSDDELSDSDQPRNNKPERESPQRTLSF